MLIELFNVFFVFIANPLNQICPTAQWNSTFRIAAGYTSAAGTTYDRLNYPADVKYDGYGYLYVADTNNHRIMRFPNSSKSFDVFNLNSHFQSDFRLN